MKIKVKRPKCPWGQICCITSNTFKIENVKTHLTDTSTSTWNSQLLSCDLYARMKSILIDQDLALDKEFSQILDLFCITEFLFIFR